MQPKLRLTFAIASMLCAPLGLKAERILAPCSVAAEPGGTMRVELVLLNESGREAEKAPEGELKARIHAGTMYSDAVTLKPESVGNGVSGGGAYQKIQYTFTIPAGVMGPVILDVPGLGCTPVMFSVQAPRLAEAVNRAEAPVGGGDEAKMEAAARETAMRKATRLLPGVAGHEPVYFGLGASDGVNAKFQVSLKYNPFDLVPVYLGYTQTSIWDLHSNSKPFHDTAYRPSFFYQDDAFATWGGGAWRFGYQGGFEHESNGKGSGDSRSINILFVRPRLEWKAGRFSKFVVSPKLYEYIEKSENSDIPQYRGYADLYLAYLYKDWRVSTTLRKGTQDWRGSVQVDVVLPFRETDELLARLGAKGMNGYFFMQYFNGWGESILDYNRKLHSQFRAGIMVVP